VSEIYSCPQCQRVVLPGDQFCAGCGCALTSEAPEQIQPSETPEESFWKRFPLSPLQSALNRPWLIISVSALGVLILGYLAVFRPWQAVEPLPLASASASPSVSESPVVADAAALLTAVPSPAPELWRIKEGLVNIRSTPSLQGEVLARVKQGASYPATGQTADQQGHHWIELKLEQGTGWVSSTLLEAVPRVAVSASPLKAQASALPEKITPPGRLLNHEKLGGWMLAKPEDRQRTALAMTRLMFPDEVAERQKKRALLLETCISGSGEDTKINHHDVAEIAAICALLLGWQEESKAAGSASSKNPQ